MEPEPVSGARASEPYNIAILGALAESLNKLFARKLR
jgi:hypothetical protein